MKCSLLTLSSYVDGELDTGRHAEVDAHLVGCDRCRKGVECLREESEGFGALGRLHISDGGVHAFMEQLGLIGPDDVLPPRPPLTPGSAGRGAPPWVAPAGTGPVLPWTPRRDAAASSDPDQPSLPFSDQVPSADPEMTAGPLPIAMPFPTAAPFAEDEVHLSGRSIGAALAAPSPGPPAISVPEPVTEQDLPAAGPAIPVPEPVAEQELPAAGPAISMPLGGAGMAVEGVARQALTNVPNTSFEPEVGASRPVLDALFEWRGVGVGPPAAPPPDGSAPAVRPASQHEAEPDYPWPPANQLWGSGDAPPPASLPIDAAVETSAGDEDPWSWAPQDRSLLEQEPKQASPPDPAAALPVDEGYDRLPEWDASAAAGAGRGTWREAEEERSGPDTTPDPLIDPLIARVARPPRMVQPTLISRLRDEVALRLTLTRAGSGGDPGIATLPRERGRRTAGAAGLSGSLVTTAMLQAPDRERTILPGDTGMGVAARPPLAVPEDPGSPVPTAQPWRRAPTIAEELPGPEAFSGGPMVRDLDRGQLPPGRHARRLGERRRSPLGISGSSVLRMVAGLGDLPDRARRAGGRSRQRWLAVAVLAALLLVVGLVISHAGQSAGGAPAAANLRPSLAAVATPSLRTQPTANLGPSASVAPSPVPTAGPTASPAPTATPAPGPAAPPAQTVGSGGTGWQLQDIRCCHVQVSGYTRIVFDLSGSGAAPTAAVSFPTPTTVVISFSGVAASGSFSITDGGVITGMTWSAGSAAAFRFTVSRTVSVKDWEYLPRDSAHPSSPLMYFDLG